MTAQDVQKHFGEFLDAARREPILVIRNDRPVGIMISIEDAADTLIPEIFMEQEAGYEEWLTKEIGSTLARVDAGAISLVPHEEVAASLRIRIEEKLERKAK